MKNYLFIDTETTGLDPAQDKIVSMAWQLFDASSKSPKKILQAYGLVKPKGWTIDENGKAFEVHGITQQQAMTEGKDIVFHLTLLNNAIRKYQPTIVAHNLEFDEGMVLAEAERCAMTSLIKIWDKAQKFCTAKGIAPMYDKEYISLKDVYRQMFAQEVPDHHNALADVVACARVFFFYQKHLSLQ